MRPVLHLNEALGCFPHLLSSAPRPAASSPPLDLSFSPPCPRCLLDCFDASRGVRPRRAGLQGQGDGYRRHPRVAGGSPQGGRLGARVPAARGAVSEQARQAGGRGGRRKSRGRWCFGAALIIMLPAVLCFCLHRPPCLSVLRCGALSCVLAPESVGDRKPVARAMFVVRKQHLLLSFHVARRRYSWSKSSPKIASRGQWTMLSQNVQSLTPPRAPTRHSPRRTGLMRSPTTMFVTPATPRWLHVPITHLRGQVSGHHPHR